MYWLFCSSSSVPFRVLSPVSRWLLRLVREGVTIQRKGPHFSAGSLAPLGSPLPRYCRTSHRVLQLPAVTTRLPFVLTTDNSQLTTRRRERVGVEPTGAGTTDAHAVLKTGGATGPHPPPQTWARNDPRPRLRSF